MALSSAGGLNSPAIDDAMRKRDDIALPWKRTLTIMIFAQMMTAVGFSSIFPFLPLYVDSLGARSGLSVELLSGLVYSGQAFTMMLASPIWGALADRHGRKLMVERAMFGGAILLFLMALVRSAEELVLLRALQGVVTGTVAATNALVASQVPRVRAGYAMGLLQVGQGIGIALGPVIGGVVADSLGYSAAFYATATLLFMAGLLVLFGVKEESMDAAGREGRAGFLASWRHVVSMPGVAATYGMRFISQLGRMMIIPVMPLFIQSLLADAARVNTFTGMVVGVASITTTGSAAFLGRLGDRVGHRRVILVSAFLAALLFFPQSLATAGWHLLVLQGLVGLALGGIIPILSSLLASYTEPGEEGAAYGLDNSVNAGSRVVAPMLGAGVALAFGLRATFVATGLLFLFTTAVGVWLLPRPEALAVSSGDGGEFPGNG